MDLKNKTKQKKQHGRIWQVANEREGHRPFGAGQPFMEDENIRSLCISLVHSKWIRGPWETGWSRAVHSSTFQGEKGLSMCFSPQQVICQTRGSLGLEPDPFKGGMLAAWSSESLLKREQPRRRGQQELQL